LLARLPIKRLPLTTFEGETSSPSTITPLIDRTFTVPTLLCHTRPLAVVSQDGYLLLRRRSSDTELYPSAWEAGIGEFMHGPENTPDPEYKSGPRHSQFPHFTENGLPDLFLFLKNAVAEELGYHEAQQE